MIRLRYVAVVSPSTSGFVARMTSSTVPSARRPSSSRTCSCSGPTLSMGDITPPSTWYSPWNEPVRSMACTSRGSETTQMRLRSRVGSSHTSQCSRVA